MGSSVHGWVRIKELITLPTFRGPWGHTMVLGQIRVEPKFGGGAHKGRDRMERSHSDLLIPNFSSTAHTYGGSRIFREN